MRTRCRNQVWLGAAVLLLVVATACGASKPDNDPPSGSVSVTSAQPTTPAASPTLETTGYVAAVNNRCRELLTQVLNFDIGNAVTIDQFLGKHEKLVKAIATFDAKIHDIPVTDAEQAAATAFKAYQRFSDTADAQVMAAARTGDQQRFDAANAAFIAEIHADPPELKNMHAAGIQCNAR